VAEFSGDSTLIVKSEVMGSDHQTTLAGFLTGPRRSRTQATCAAPPVAGGVPCGGTRTPAGIRGHFPFASIIRRSAFNSAMSFFKSISDQFTPAQLRRHSIIADPNALRQFHVISRAPWHDVDSSVLP
jgi:hypothetical protein